MRRRRRNADAGCSLTYGAVMLTPTFRVVAPLALLFGLIACGADPDVVDQDSSGKSDEKSEQPAEEQGAIIDSGFGQVDEYVYPAALVKNTSDHVGQTVTVSFNVKDESGEVIKTGTQVEGFSWVGQELALVTQIDLQPGQKADSVEATLLVEDDGIGASEPQPKLPAVDAKFAQDEYGGQVARYKVQNSTDKPLKDLRIGVICKNKKGNVNGGGFEYPDFVPPSGEIALDTSVSTSGNTASCKAYVGPGIF